MRRDNNDDARRYHNSSANEHPGASDPLPPQYSAHHLSRSRGSARYTRKRASRTRRHGARTVLIVILVAVLAVVGVAFGYTAFLNSQMQTNDQELLDSLKQSNDNEPFYMLLMGVDTGEEREAEGDSGRTDSIMLVRIDPQNVKATMVSIHRDTLVPIEGHGNDKINAAYAYGGKALAVKTVSQFAGVDISHYAEVDFDSFTKIVDTVGGVEVTLPTDVYDPDYTGLDLKAGTQTLDGNTALLLCRCRHAYDAYGDGDRYRAANQRMVIAAVIKKVLASDTLTMIGAINSMAGSVSTDMSVSSILSLAAKMKDIDFDTDVYTAMNPTTSEYIHGGWYELSNDDEWKAMMKRVDAGENPLADGETDPTAGVAGSVSSSSDSSTSTGDSDGSGSGDGSNDSGSDGSDSSDSDASDHTGTVLVANGAGAPGLAAQVANQLSSAGYTTTPTDLGRYGNSTTTVYYNGSSNEAKANAVASELGSSDISVRENDGTYSTDYDVVVIAGENLAQ